MSYWNRWDIAAAYHHFTLNWRCGYFNTEIAPGECSVRDAVFKFCAQLDRIRYRPGLSDSKLATISPNAKAIYRQLVQTYIGVHSTRH